MAVPRLTPMIKILMIVCVVIWVLQLFLDGIEIRLPNAPGTYPMLTGIFGVTPAYAIGHGWIWQMFTYQFLHSPGGPMHLLFNMLMLWMFGSELERFWGGRAFLRYYLICGTGAGIIAALFNFMFDARWVPTIGASGALYGLFVGFGIVFANRTVLFMLLFPVKAWVMAAIMCGLTLFYTLGSSGSSTSHIAHLGGAVIGFLYLKRAWRIRELIQDLRWRWMRRRFKVVSPPKDDFDRWVN